MLPSLSRCHVRVLVQGTKKDGFLAGAWEKKALKTVAPVELCTVDYRAAVKLITMSFPLRTVDMPIKYLSPFLGSKGKNVLSLRGSHKGRWGKVTRVVGRQIAVKAFNGGSDFDDILDNVVMLMQ